jgi:hypothetical protein
MTRQPAGAQFVPAPNRGCAATASTRGFHRRRRCNADWSQAPGTFVTPLPGRRRVALLFVLNGVLLAQSIQEASIRIADQCHRCLDRCERVEAFMPDGSVAPLSPQEEIALRRIAHGSFAVDTRTASRLASLALIERNSKGLRLTPLGRLRFDALPKAPLIAQRRSVHHMTGYVEGLIEKAQSRAVKQVPTQYRPTVPLSTTVPAPAGLLPEALGEEGEACELPDRRPIYFFFDGEHWKSRAERALMRTRCDIMEHRKRQERLCDDSVSRIRASLSLLKTSVPRRPAGLDVDQ